MDKKLIMTLILTYTGISLFINYFFNKKPIENKSNIIRIEKNKIISNKPIEFDLTLIENKINKSILLPNKIDLINENIIKLENNQAKYIFSSRTGSLLSYEYKQPITKQILSVFNYSLENNELPPLSMTINNILITDFNIDTNHNEENTIIFYKNYNDCNIIRKYCLKNNIIESSIEIQNPMNKNLGTIKIISEEQSLLKQDELNGAFSYNEEEKIVKFLSKNELILDQSVILNPELIGLQSSLFTQAIIQKNNSFNRAFFKKNDSNKIMYFLESEIINNNTLLSFEWYIGPKIYSILNKIDNKLGLIMEYGLFSKISEILISIIFFLTTIFNSFGIALLIFIVLTKIIFIPFASSIKENNKKSKEFQQKLEYIKAKYHNEPDKKNAEEMALFKKYGIFPGMAAKIPQIFNLFIVFSMQSLLRNNIQLYQVPLGLWLTDGSLPDQYYILPIIFIIFIYLNINNLKITPMMKVGILMLMIFFIYMFSFWSSSIQLFIVGGVIAGYLETKYFAI